MSAEVIANQINPINGDISREGYIDYMQGLVVAAGREDLFTKPNLARRGWNITDEETGVTFDSWARGSRTEVSNMTMNRIHDLACQAGIEGIEVIARLEEFSGNGDNYQFGWALATANGELQDQILNALVEHEIMLGFPGHSLGWIKRTYGKDGGATAEAKGYDLAFYENLWEFSQHEDVGLRGRLEITEALVNDTATLISPDTWASAAGMDAKVRWSDRHEKVQDQIDLTLTDQGYVLWTNPELAAADHTIHVLSNDIERRIYDRWQVNFRGKVQPGTNEVTAGLCLVNLGLRQVEARSAIAKLEQEAKANPKGITGQCNVSRIALSDYEALIFDMPYASPTLTEAAGIINQKLVASEVLAQHGTMVSGLRSRFERFDKPRRGYFG